MTTSSTATFFIQNDDGAAGILRENDVRHNNNTMSCSFLKSWWRESLWPGMGLFGESYLLFSIGTLTPLWEKVYPDCFQDTCSPRLLESLTYGVVMGVILGMVLLGYLSDAIGRRKGSILTAGFMSLGSLGLIVVALLATTAGAETIFRATVVSLVVFGIGVGGEYPLSSSLASERAMEQLSRRRHQLEAMTSTSPNRQPESSGVSQASNELKSHRGRKVQLVFTMQGTGIWFNTLTMLILFWVLTGGVQQDANDNDNKEYEIQDLITIWRITYGIGAMILWFVLVTRILFLDESKVWLDARAENHRSAAITPTTASSFQTDAPSDSQARRKLKLVHKHYGSRMFGSGLSWLLWDISFYGNKLFQSTFLLALVGEDASLAQITSASLLNATVALFGYYGAAFLVDIPRVGRRQLQTIGFVANGFLFLSCGLLTSYSSAPSSLMVCLYLLSSFVGQLGPNCTTFLIPAEIVPTEQRSYCHGVCAAAGKVGALLASVTFHFFPNGADLFYASGATSLLAALVTYGFVPETSNLDVLELDLQWKLLLSGDASYEGPANHFDHSSVYENYCRRRRRT